jgi:hypothetical protein
MIGSRSPLEGLRPRRALLPAHFLGDELPPRLCPVPYLLGLLLQRLEPGKHPPVSGEGRMVGVVRVASFPLKAFSVIHVTNYSIPYYLCVGGGPTSCRGPQEGLDKDSTIDATLRGDLPGRVRPRKRTNEWSTSASSTDRERGYFRRG